MTWESKSQDVTPDGSVLVATVCTLAFSMSFLCFKNLARPPGRPGEGSETGLNLRRFYGLRHLRVFPVPPENTNTTLLGFRKRVNSSPKEDALRAPDRPRLRDSGSETRSAAHRGRATRS